MYYLGEMNLLTSRFVTGMRRPKIRESEDEEKQLKDVIVLHRWIEWKEADWGMATYRMKRTGAIVVLHHIELGVLKEMVTDLALIYKKQHPYSTKEDFMSDLFRFTVWDLQRIIDHPRIFPFGNAHCIKASFYYHIDLADQQFTDYVLPPDQDMGFFRQYFRRVLKFFEVFDYEDLGVNVRSEKTHAVNEEPSGAEWAAIFFYASDSGLVTQENTLEETRRTFIKKHKIEATEAYFYKALREVKTGLLKTLDYPIPKLEKIIPILKEHYPGAVSKVESDIKILEENKHTDF